MGLFSAGTTYYLVFLPGKRCELYYLSKWKGYKPADVVLVPYGAANEQVAGIVMCSQNYSIWNRPVPLRKMKYIIKKAPVSVEQQYRKIQKQIKKHIPDKLAWIDELETMDALFGD